VTVRSVDDAGATTDDGRITADAVVVAAGPRAAAELLGAPVPVTRSLTTFYHLAPRSPAERTLLHLDADRRGPVLNTAVLTDAAPSYAPGRTLISSTVLGVDDSAASEQRVRIQLGAIYGTDTAGWERVAAYAIRDALPDTPPGTPLRKPVTVRPGLYVAGDHRDTASLQGALVSGHRAAAAVLARLGIVGRT
jgi:glycine/D-amino acid oxidase-like deaminating enzyme